MPVRPAVEGTTYRRLRFGKLADLSLLDLRSFRSQQVSLGDGDVDDPGRTLTGRAQLDWLKAGLSASDTTWRLVGTSVMISPFALGSLPATLLKPLAKLLGLPQEGLALNTDQWDGYTADRRELLAHLRGNAIRNTVFLTGDIHMAWANDVPVNAGTYPLSASAATEFVVTSVTSDNLDDILKVGEGTVDAVASPLIRAANRHVHWVDTDRHGFGVLDLTAERAQMDYYVLSDRTEAGATAAWARSYRTRSGTQRIERAAAPSDHPRHKGRGVGGPDGSDGSDGSVCGLLQRVEEAERHPPGGLGGLLVEVGQVGIGVEVSGARVPVDLHVGSGPAHPQVPGGQPVVGLERVRLGDVQLHRQSVGRGVLRDVGGAVQEQQPSGLLVAEGQRLRHRGAEGEPRVHQASLRVRRRRQDGPLQQLVLAHLVLVLHALLDGVERAALEKVRRPHLVSGRAQPVRGPAPRGAVRRSSERA